MYRHGTSVTPRRSQRTSCSKRYNSWSWPSDAPVFLKVKLRSGRIGQAGDRGARARKNPRESSPATASSPTRAKASLAEWAATALLTPSAAAPRRTRGPPVGRDGLSRAHALAPGCGAGPRAARRYVPFSLELNGHECRALMAWTSLSQEKGLFSISVEIESSLADVKVL